MKKRESALTLKKKRRSKNGKRKTKRPGKKIKPVLLRNKREWNNLDQTR